MPWERAWQAVAIGVGLLVFLRRWIPRQMQHLQPNPSLYSITRVYSSKVWTPENHAQLLYEPMARSHLSASGFPVSPLRTKE